MDNVSQFQDRETLEHEARQWLVRLDSNQPLSPDDKQQLHHWMARSPAHRQELERIAEFWDNSNILTELYIPMQETARAKRSPLSFSGLMTGWLLSPRNAALAMSVLLTVVGLRVYWFAAPLDASNGIYAAAIGELRIETLVDGSVLEINTDSQVQVDYSEHTRKIRLLRGEAHFRVAHDTAWPFDVHAGKGMVTAVGTAFSVRLQHEQLSVIVTDGRVDLAASRPQQTTVIAQDQSAVATRANPLPLQKVGTLNEGQGVTFNPLPGNNPPHKLVQLPLEQKEMARQLAWREGYLVFEGEPLSLVVAELNRYLPFTVEIADPRISSLPIGGRFKVGELEALFDVLETSFNIQVSRLDDQHIKLFSKP